MPDPNLPARRRIHPAIPFFIVIFLILYLGLNAWIFLYGSSVFNFNPFIKKAATNVSVVKQQGFSQITGGKPTPTPRPKPSELPGGVQIYEFSHGSGVTGPRISEATIDPQTPAKGAKQTVTVTIKNQSPVSSVSATLSTDTQVHEYTFTLTKGTATDGTWQGSWTVNDTYDYIYYLKFHLKSPTGNWDGGMKFRN